MGSIAIFPTLGSDAYPAWFLANKRNEMGFYPWAEECIAHSAMLVRILESGGEVRLDADGETLQVGPHFDYQQHFLFPTARWKETVVTLAWIYSSIRTWGGSFVLNQEVGLVAEQRPHDNIRFLLQIGPQYEDDLSVSIPEDEGLGGGSWYLIYAVMSRLWELYSSADLHGEAWSLQRLKDEVTLFGNTPGEPIQEFCVAGFLNYRAQPWMSFGFESEDENWYPSETQPKSKAGEIQTDLSFE